MTFFKQTEDQQNIEKLFSYIDELRAEIANIKKENLALAFRLDFEKTAIKDNNGLLGRMEDLEVWRAKVHNLMIMTNPTSKKERLSPIAKKWGEKYQG